MSDIPPPPEPDLPQAEPENKLTSDKFEEFKEALEILYVPANLSGRIQFVKAWPEAGAHIFGAELIQYDEEGTQDRDHRVELEEQAAGRQAELLEFMEGIEENSVDNGALQLEYVQDAIKGFGRDLALLVYGTKIVDRFLPPPPGAAKSVDPDVQDQNSVSAPETSPEAAPVIEQPVQASDSSPVETPAEPAMPSLPVDAMDNVKPIDMGAPPEQASVVPPSSEVPAMPEGAPVEAPEIPAVSPIPEQPASSPVSEPPAEPVDPVSEAPVVTPIPEQPAVQPEAPAQEDKTQRPVSMKFVPSKDSEDDPDAPPSGSGA